MAGNDALIRALTAELRPLDVAANQAWWLASTDVSETHERRRVAADIALREALGNPVTYRNVTEALETADDPLEERQLVALGQWCRPHQVTPDLRAEIAELEASVDSAFNAFRGRIDGAPVDDNTIGTILRQSNDAAQRRAAWEASKEVGAEVADSVRRLARLRNQAAHGLGFRDFFAMSLATSELDEDRLFRTLDEIDTATREPFSSWKQALDAALASRFGCTTNALRPWHYDDPFFQTPPAIGGVRLDRELADADLDALTLRTYDGLGLDVRPALERSDLSARERKSQHAFCIDVDREGDVRVLSNNVPGEQWAETMLHEFGHAIYDLRTDPELPWLLRTMHPLTTEGVAMLFGRLVRSPEWLSGIAGVPAATVAGLEDRLRATRRAALLVFARWVLVMTNFERSLYRDPDGDLDSTWWELVERFQLLRRPDDRVAPDWAAKLHVALAPVYYQNYLYGELVASQLQATLERECGGIVGQRDAGALLHERVFRPGLSMRWDGLIEHATGEPLSVKPLAAELSGV